MVKTVITISASQDLKDIKHFYKNHPQRVLDIKNKIIKGYKTLETFPMAGPIEPLFKDSSFTYRSLVIDKDYKLIYYISEDIIYIVGIWDCRQDPLKMFDKFC